MVFTYVGKKVTWLEVNLARVITVAARVEVVKVAEDMHLEWL